MGRGRLRRLGLEFGFRRGQLRVDVGLGLHDEFFSIAFGGPPPLVHSVWFSSSANHTFEAGELKPHRPGSDLIGQFVGLALLAGISAVRHIAPKCLAEVGGPRVAFSIQKGRFLTTEIECVGEAIGCAGRHRLRSPSFDRDRNRL